MTTVANQPRSNNATSGNPQVGPDNIFMYTNRSQSIALHPGSPFTIMIETLAIEYDNCFALMVYARPEASCFALKVIYNGRVEKYTCDKQWLEKYSTSDVKMRAEHMINVEYIDFQNFLTTLETWAAENKMRVVHDLL